MKSSHDLVLRNNSGSKSKTSLVEEFVVRTEEYEKIMSDLEIAVINQEPINYLIVGQRGAGKTTLLHRVKYGVEDNDQFRKVLAVMLSEEQYNMSDMINLWERVIEYCQDWYGWNDIAKLLEEKLDGNDVDERIIRKIILNKLQREDSRLLIFIENINIFLKKLGEKQQYILESIVSASPNINLIGSSTTLEDSHVNFNSKEFSYFKLLNLEGLNKRECMKLLLKIADRHGYEQQIKHIIKNHPSRIESLRRLTGGVPRTISYMFQIFLDNEDGRAIKDLYQLIDTLTLLYKSELDQLSTQQQKVVDVIAKNWDAIGVKEITKVTRMESKNISTILANLEKNSVIERVPTRTKNNLYRIKERFLNIWYLMRLGRRAEQENVKWLVRFFEIWCDESELRNRVSRHIEELKEGTYDEIAAIDMGNTYLSCSKVNADDKYLLYKQTKNILSERLGKSVKISDKDLYNRINTLLEDGKPDEALNVLEEISSKDEKYYSFCAWVYMIKGDHEKVLESAFEAFKIDENNAYASLVVGITYYHYLKDPIKAEHYFKIAEKGNHPYAIWRLGSIAYDLHHDVSSAERYFRKAIKKKMYGAYASLTEMYLDEGNWEVAEQTAWEQIQVKHSIGDAYNRLGYIYVKRENYPKAVDALMAAINEKHSAALSNLTLLFFEKQALPAAKLQKILLKAIEDGAVHAYELLGQLYKRHYKDLKRAEQTYIEGLQKGDSGSAHQLGHIYEDQKEFGKADEMFLRAAELGISKALLCYVECIYDNQRNEFKTAALDVFTKRPELIEQRKLDGIPLYAKILLWNNKIDESLKVFKSLYPVLQDVNQQKEGDEKEESLNTLMSGIVEYFLLLMAKEQYEICREIFEDKIGELDLRSILKPTYYVLMEKMKKEFPVEYLKAGPELEETIKEINNMINDLKTNIK